MFDSLISPFHIPLLLGLAIAVISAYPWLRLLTRHSRQASYSGPRPQGPADWFGTPFDREDGDMRGRIGVMLNEQLRMPFYGVRILEGDEPIYVAAIILGAASTSNVRLASKIARAAKRDIDSALWICTHLNAKHDALISAKINESAASHAWWETVILSLTVTGRHSGIVASDLSFLRKTHPALWAAVSSCGSPSCFAAGAGIVSHYLAESVAYKPLLEPFTDEAEIAMEMGLWEAKHA